jgi:uncharacterized membrane protein
VTVIRFSKLYGVGAVVFVGLDLIWLGVLARGFYLEHLGYLMRADVRWGPALLFYLVYVAALVIFGVMPGLEKQSLGRAVLMGGFFGFAAYAAFDLTSLALVRDFPTVVAIADLAWGHPSSVSF